MFTKVLIFAKRNAQVFIFPSFFGVCATSMGPRSIPKRREGDCCTMELERRRGLAILVQRDGNLCDKGGEGGNVRL